MHGCVRSQKIQTFLHVEFVFWTEQVSCCNFTPAENRRSAKMWSCRACFPELAGDFLRSEDWKAIFYLFSSAKKNFHSENFPFPWKKCTWGAFEWLLNKVHDWLGSKLKWNHNSILFFLPLFRAAIPWAWSRFGFEDHISQLFSDLVTEIDNNSPKSTIGRSRKGKIRKLRRVHFSSCVLRKYKKMRAFTVFVRS